MVRTPERKGRDMRLTIIAGLSGVAAIALAMSGGTATAAPKKRVMSQGDVSLSSQARVQRARTRITVRPRSYLDGGTEVLPGERKYSDYAIFPGSLNRPSAIVDNTGPHHRSPLPGPFDLAGRNNPYGW
jgi:hypothetical protein